MVVNGNTGLKKRDELYATFDDHTKLMMVATYGVAAVGINIPALHHIVLIEAGKSVVRVIQSCGRGLRRTNIKLHVDIHDICSNNSYSARHLGERKKRYKKVEYPYVVTKVTY
jgi:superfamily II DNA or RNA helicase